MDITTALLCDHAQVREGLLFVASGGITRSYRTELPAPLGVFAALVIELDRFEAERPHELRVVVVDEDGRELAEVNGQIQAGPVQDLMIDEKPTIPLPLDLRGVEVQRFGPVEVRAYLDGEIRRSLTLQVMQSPDE